MGKKKERRPDVVIRADGSHRIGLGHIMRMVELADRLRFRSGLDLEFVSLTDTAANGLINGAGHRIHCVSEGYLSREVAGYLGSLACRPVVINDVMDTGRGYIESLRPHARSIVNFDDGGAGVSKADIVINAMPCSFLKLEDSVVGGVRRFEGPKYMIIGRQFCEVVGVSRAPAKRCDSALVTLGGSDTHGHSVVITDGLRQVSELRRIDVVVGALFQHQHELKCLASRDSRIKVRCNVSNLARMMADYDIAIVAGGLTAFEAAAIALPTASVASELFEEVNLQWLHDRGVTRFMGNYQVVDSDSVAESVRTLITNHNLRLQMAERGPEIVDGCGCNRVAEIIENEIEATQ